MDIDTSRLRTDLPQVAMRHTVKYMPTQLETAIQPYKMKLTIIGERTLN